jgi:two-component system OmpR family response regulator
MGHPTLRRPPRPLQPEEIGSETIHRSDGNMQQSYTILCVDDDPRISRLIERYLGNEGYRVYSASSGNEMWKKLAELPVNLVLLDVRLPDDDGFSLVKKLRTLPNLAIIMLTGKADVLDKVLGLELGADDYVTKPFNERELLARVRTVLRRPFQEQPVPGDSPSRTLARFAGWQLDQQAQELTSPEGRRVVLTTREFQLLAALVEHAPRVLSRDSILEMLVGRDWTPVDRSVDVLIGKLRKKLGDDPQQPRLIKTMRGIGYKLGVPVE